MEHKGGCLRGQVRYRITAAPVVMRLCWCGNRMHRKFCPECGTHMFSEAESRPHLVIVRNGTLDDTGLLKPGGTIWTDSAPEWAWIDETLPQHAGQPPPPVLPPSGP